MFSVYKEKAGKNYGNVLFEHPTTLTDMASMTKFMTNVPNPKNAMAVNVKSYKSDAVSPCVIVPPFDPSSD